MKITIPQPCHENWQNMDAVEKGRFCGACQKQVHDFTKSSDRAILDAFKEDGRLCGRFLPSQLERELTSRENSKNWMAAAAGVLLLSNIAGNEAAAQEATPVEQYVDRDVVVGKPVMPKLVTVSGTIVDENDLPLPGCIIAIPYNAKAAITNLDGRFSVAVQKGDAIRVSYAGYSDATAVISDKRPLKIKLKTETNDEITTVTMGMGMGNFTKKRTFFGRIFHSIGNIFR